MEKDFNPTSKNFYYKIIYEPMNVDHVPGSYPFCLF